MSVARDDLGRAARKRGIEGQVTIIRHFRIRCIVLLKKCVTVVITMAFNLLRLLINFIKCRKCGSADTVCYMYGIRIRVVMGGLEYVSLII